MPVANLAIGSNSADICRQYARRARAFGVFFFFSSRRRHTRFDCDWSSDVCSSDLTSVSTRRSPMHGLQRVLLLCTILALPTSAWAKDGGKSDRGSCPADVDAAVTADRKSVV